VVHWCCLRRCLETGNAGAGLDLPLFDDQPTLNGETSPPFSKTIKRVGWNRQKANPAIPSTLAFIKLWMAAKPGGVWDWRKQNLPHHY